MINVESSKLVKLKSNGTISSNGHLVYYKKCKDNKYGVEIIIERLAKRVGINCANYDIVYDRNATPIYLSSYIGTDARFDTIGNLGVDFKTKYVDDILFEIKDDITPFEEKIKSQLYKIYYFDILTLNPDRTIGNYGIRREFNDTDLFILDNENSFVSYQDPELRGVRNFEDYDSINDELVEFLSSHDSIYISIFLEMYNRLTPKILDLEMDCVTKYYGALVNRNVWMKSYKENYENLKSVFDNERIKRLVK